MKQRSWRASGCGEEESSALEYLCMQPTNNFLIYRTYTNSLFNYYECFEDTVYVCLSLEYTLIFIEIISLVAKKVFCH